MSFFLKCTALAKVVQINDELNTLKILYKIEKYKSSDDFDAIYNFLDHLSQNRYQKLMINACQEGLTNKKKKGSEGYMLHEASNKGNLKLVKSLIECGCDIEIKDIHECTPLMYASLNNHLEVVKYLISVGSNKEAKDNYGNTPLIYASYNGHIDVVKYLISVGADKEAKTNRGRTPLIYASIEGKLDIVRYLISVGADKEAKDNDGNTPLVLASKKGHNDVVKYLSRKYFIDFGFIQSKIWKIITLLASIKRLIR
ncbi:histone-lysine N-methyltransferase, H3 lysine-9 specific, putative [Trichomonas vaginalis G3]|uniref:Histone-lysine N-methyltransferase, H3 lysine-9 specific, putative n=1 Tax=Trichomonas vaginalis (strain ATCC PRA-98 / G3) TaxID=412133 RepID=A2DRS8_TRIV3|nr:histone-lysine N-methyltransferase family [Trichomonas vaginalis G3]EAY16875.1 histone-lysine N-methyltransferase, H3 lysine-9 specific, putative [Trichomonas vaginalis G3]KAI5489138.1 histone-lysine N-methyltransferase family [Trichomonas vaginalis G3]|eukprot:XP_001329098.1 histone-lysine N-methyltransferase, H3 lysine-9 specific [Trichomonas vaginalis G3]